MQNMSFLLLFTLSSALAACAMPDAPPGLPTIHITSGQPPELVAFREGVDGAWQHATMKTPTSYEFEVNGPYVVSVVCQYQVLGELLTWQAARTLDDPHDLSSPCDKVPSKHAITGHMVQAGRLKLGDSSALSRVPDWDFHLSAADGTYDLLAKTDDRIALRRGIKIDGDIALTPPVDVVQQGTAFADAAFTITNAAPDELLAALVYLKLPTFPDSALLYAGPITTAKVVPDSMLVATDTQRATLTAIKGTAARSLRRPFRIGDNTVYTLPPPIGGVQWAVERGRLSARWATLPDLDTLSVFVNGPTTPGTLIPAHLMDVSSRFLTTTGISRITLDTDIPGYKPEWKVDFAVEYDRLLIADRFKNGERATSSEGEFVNGSTASLVPTPRISRAHDRSDAALR